MVNPARIRPRPIFGGVIVTGLFSVAGFPFHLSDPWAPFTVVKSKEGSASKIRTQGSPGWEGYEHHPRVVPKSD